MSVTISQTRRLSQHKAEIEFTSSLGATAPVWIRQGGKRLLKTTAKTIRIHIEDGESPDLWLNDDPALAWGNDADFTSPQAKLQWFLDESAANNYDYVLVEENIATVWTQRAKIHVSTLAWYTFWSRFLEDDTSHQFRITPYAKDGNAATATAITVHVVRIPDAPSVTITYNAVGRTLTIAAA